MPSSLKNSTFKIQLTQYKQQIDEAANEYSQQLLTATHEEFGHRATQVTSYFTELLQRDSKRVRGSLVLHGYQMAGGDDTATATQLALVVEMIHSYILMIDDIQDNSLSRRGGPAAHVGLAHYHQTEQLAGSDEHFGLSMTLNSLLVGHHEAFELLGQLKVSPSILLAVSNHLHRSLVITGHGQTNDIFNEVVGTVSQADINNVLEWKTAHYTFIAPLQAGMLLAGATPKQCETIVSYARHAGYAFQIGDDVIGLFGKSKELGKNPMDDIREGKRTILTYYALQHTPRPDQNFLLHMLGNTQLSQSEFNRCKEIIKYCGAYDHALASLAERVKLAKQSLEQVAISAKNREFLADLADYLRVRTS